MSSKNFNLTLGQNSQIFLHTKLFHSKTIFYIKGHAISLLEMKQGKRAGGNGHPYFVLSEGMDE